MRALLENRPILHIESCKQFGFIDVETLNVDFWSRNGQETVKFSNFNEMADDDFHIGEECSKVSWTKAVQVKVFFGK